MMQQIPLLQIANQSLNVVLDTGEYVLTIREANGCMMADIERDGLAVVTGVRCLTGEPLIPYAYLQSGNFVFSTTNDDLPDWNQFGLTQGLYYLTDAEMA